MDSSAEGGQPPSACRQARASHPVRPGSDSWSVPEASVDRAYQTTSRGAGCRSARARHVWMAGDDGVASVAASPRWFGSPPRGASVASAPQVAVVAARMPGDMPRPSAERETMQMVDRGARHIQPQVARDRGLTARLAARPRGCHSPLTPRIQRRSRAVATLQGTVANSPTVARQPTRRVDRPGGEVVLSVSIEA